MHQSVYAYRCMFIIYADVFMITTLFFQMPSPLIKSPLVLVGFL